MPLLPLYFILIVASLAATTVDALNPAVISAYKFFDSVTGDEIVLRGIDYYPRPNIGILDRNGVDFFTEEFRYVWERDLEYLKELNVNAVRLYSVDPKENHDAFMCAMDRAGIYVILELESIDAAITVDLVPDCYPTHLKKRGQQVIQQFAQYPNTLAFSTGNEVNHYAPSGQPELNGPCQKKFLRDMRKYIDECKHIRKVPVGLVSADSDRKENTLYYNCDSSGDPFENAEWFGLNSYVFCDGSVKTYDTKNASGFVTLTEDFATYNYSIPVVLTEFGCLSKSFGTEDGYEGQRDFRQAEWLVSDEHLIDQFAGGFVFEYSIEAENAKGMSPFPFQKFGYQNYGVGYLEPELCDEVDSPCNFVPTPAFYHLKEAYSKANVSLSTNLRDFEPDPTRLERSQCPEQFPPLDSFKWKTDRFGHFDLRCPRKSKFTCPADLEELRGRYSHHHKSPTDLSKPNPQLPIILGIFVGAVVIASGLALCTLLCERDDDHFEEPTLTTPMGTLHKIPLSKSAGELTNTDESSALLSDDDMESRPTYTDGFDE